MLLCWTWLLIWDWIMSDRNQKSVVRTSLRRAGVTRFISCKLFSLVLDDRAQSLQSCPALQIYGPPGSSVYGIFLGKSTGMGFYALLHVIFPTQRSKLPLLSPATPALQADPLPLSRWGKPCFRYWGTANWTWTHPSFLHMEGMLSSVDKKEETRGT